MYINSLITILITVNNILTFIYNRVGCGLIIGNKILAKSFE